MRKFEIVTPTDSSAFYSSEQDMQSFKEYEMEQNFTQSYMVDDMPPFCTVLEK